MAQSNLNFYTIIFSIIINILIYNKKLLSYYLDLNMSQKMDNLNIREAITKQEILNCFPVLSELRPQLTQETYNVKVQAMQNTGYHLMYLQDNKNELVTSILGYRVFENLAWGKIFYIDDLSTLPNYRQQGYASKLLEWSFDKAKSIACEQLHLDIGFESQEAQRLYLKYNFNFSCQHMASIL